MSRIIDAGLSWGRYSKQIEAASDRISKGSAFDDEAVLQSFQVFVRGQKDVARSLQLTELAADVARGRYTDLESATQLVNKAAMGQIGALRRAGIQIDKNATSAQALDALLKAYSGSARTYADSATGSSEKLQVAWENLSEQAGGPLSKALAGVAEELTLIVGLMEKASKLKFPAAPGGNLGGAAGDIAKRAFRHWFPLAGLGDVARIAGSGGKGAAGPEALSAHLRGAMADAGSRAAAGATAGRANAAIREGNQVVAGINDFIQKWTAAGERYGAAQERFAEQQKKAAAHQAQMQLQRRRFAAGLENQWGWLEFGVERAGSDEDADRRPTRVEEAGGVAAEPDPACGPHVGSQPEALGRPDQLRNLNKQHADKDPLAGLMQVSSKRLAQTLAAGTGLGPGGMGRLQANIAGAEIQPTVIHNYVVLDGREVSRSTNTHNARGGARTARQTSGFRG